MLKIKKVEVNFFGVNTYIVWDSDTGDGIIIDPGMLFDEEKNDIDAIIRDNNVSVKAIVLTHMHLDHIFGVNEAAARYNVPVTGCAADAPLGARLNSQAQRFMMRMQFDPVHLTRTIADGDTISVGTHTFTAIHVPGHSPGGMAYYDSADGVLFTGDTLFDGSIGRTDLEGGSHPQLIRSITDRLMTLPDDTTVYPGHGPATTIAKERTSNPYL